MFKSKSTHTQKGKKFIDEASMGLTFERSMTALEILVGEEDYVVQRLAVRTEDNSVVFSFYLETPKYSKRRKAEEERMKWRLQNRDKS